MIHLLDFQFDIGSIWAWIYVLLAVYAVIFLVYIIGSIKTKGTVMVTAAAPQKEATVAAELAYFLPRARLTLKATARTQGSKLLSLEVLPVVDIEADTAQLYLLHYKPSIFANDEIELKVDEKGLLENLKVTTEDTLKGIVAEIARGPKDILEGFTTARVLRKEVKKESEKIIEHTRSFSITAEELAAAEIECKWIITAGAPEHPITVDASFKLKKDATPVRHLAEKEQVQGILTRPLHRQRLALEVDNAQLKEDASFEILMPNPTLLLNVPINRAAFVKKIQTPKLANGLLVENNIQKPSQLEAFASIPVNVLKSIFSIPAQLISFRVNLTRKMTELEEANKALAKAKEIAEKQEETVKKLDKMAKQSATAATGGGAEKPASQSDEEAAGHPEPAGENIPDDIFIEALEKYEAKWKSEYNLLDISIGMKESNGTLTAIKALIFRPMEKPAATKAKIAPPYIEFKSKNGETYRLPTDVQRTGGHIKSSFTADPGERCDLNTPKLPGCSISRLDSKETGTIGLKLYRNNKAYILSCYHVICSTELNKGVTEFDAAIQGKKSVISPGKENQGTNRNIIGTVEQGVLNRFMDAAIAELTDDLDLHTRICRTDQEPGDPLSVGSGQLNMRVYMSGRSSKLKNGVIKSFYANPDIDYETGTIRMAGLIATSPLAVGGDSGAPVFDENGNIVGIVVARSPSNTYVLPIRRILTHFNATIKP